MKQAQILVVAAALLTCADTGCASAPRRRPDAEAVHLIGDALPLRVQNNMPTDMSVFIVVDGSWKRIGFVAGHRSATFEIGAIERNGAPLRILATPVHGGGTARSDPLTVFPGQTVTFTIEPDLAHSVATVR
jgi:hypothetical protein